MLNYNEPQSVERCVARLNELLASIQCSCNPAVEQAVVDELNMLIPTYESLVGYSWEEDAQAQWLPRASTDAVIMHFLARHQATA